MKIRREDQVMVIAGKDRGKTGKVRQVFPEEKRLVVEGVNIIKRHTKARGGVRQAGIVDREAPLHMSNVMFVCPQCHKPTRVGFNLRDDGTKVRACGHCEAEVD
ncbi:MAG: 50S ribosomal protein L24 [Chloroflexi bacterium]|nr:50S ribosomal protein L24 [Chloroflexota bacterium]